MAVVSVDDRGRLTIPRELGISGTRAVLIAAGSFFVVIPVPKEPLKAAGSWLSSKRSRRKLKELAEKAAQKEAVERARRRRQL